ncbi:methenyl tetrahydrofolate cyclohydrolase [Halobacteroides halobius DSM 5150]|uniref:Methenyl tetrahydrofolate cyclohydrolase n=1 Tax=Halobacteroides halobius (strain ATCC 35273 / DSM 5150 / MD-1) TaxID=748449 RepID=L0K9G2_HALHC|nr:cyclodeaminase/cyclohydrolase family protein [Halobacteroides halobius]AGB41180.1 methenyl tetrahydrofolate cyclohydrolase [Halobacteroides halobius DSM 5150]
MIKIIYFFFILDYNNNIINEEAKEIITDINSSIKELSQQIASPKNPVPAGGATIATTALLGVSLLKLVFQVSQNNWNIKTKEEFNEYLTTLNTIQEDLSQAIADDTKAYQINLANNFQNQTKLKKIIAVPLQITETAKAALTVGDKLEGKVKTTVQADHKVATLNLKASIKGAITIIEANYNFFPADDNYIKKVKSKINKIKDRDEF